MGCQKITYYNEGKPLDTFRKNLKVVYAKTGINEKKALNSSTFGSLMPGRYTGGNLYRYGYQGSEKDDEIANIEGAHYTTHFREIDTRLGRMWSVDPKSTAWESPYASMANNPIINIDIQGDTIYRFNSEGSYYGWFDDGKTEVTGTFNDGKSGGGTLHTFKFHDLDNYREAIKNGNFKVRVVTNKEIDKIVDDSGVYSENAQNSPVSYAYNEGQSGGKLDFSEGPNTPKVDGTEFFGISIVSNGKESIAYDKYDFGNYLTGAAFKELDISLEFGKFGAHVNSIFFDGAGFDSDADQQAIENGYNRTNKVE